MSDFGGGGGAGEGLVCFKEEPSKRKSILATKLKKKTGNIDVDLEKCLLKLK